MSQKIQKCPISLLNSYNLQKKHEYATSKGMRWDRNLCKKNIFLWYFFWFKMQTFLIHQSQIGFFSSSICIPFLFIFPFIFVCLFVFIDCKAKYMQQPLGPPPNLSFSKKENFFMRHGRLQVELPATYNVCLALRNTSMFDYLILLLHL